MEVWKDIKGYEGLYQVSNLGRVKSLKRQRDVNLLYSNTATVPEKILKYGTSQGYLAVTLAKNKVNKKIRVHKLVALNFIPNPENKPYINHKDGNKHNNNVENLEWITPKENTKHAYANKLMHPHFNVINQYDTEGNFIKSWNGYSEINKVLGYSQQNICHCCKRRTRTAFGYVWRYADEQNNIQSDCNG